MSGYFSDCCGAAPRSNGDCDTMDFGICPECGEHCEYIEEEDPAPPTPAEALRMFVDRAENLREQGKTSAFCAEAFMLFLPVYQYATAALAHAGTGTPGPAPEEPKAA